MAFSQVPTITDVHGKQLKQPPAKIRIGDIKNKRWAKARKVPVKKETELNRYDNVVSFSFFLNLNCKKASWLNVFMAGITELHLNGLKKKNRILLMTTTSIQTCTFRNDMFEKSRALLKIFQFVRELREIKPSLIIIPYLCELGSARVRPFNCHHELDLNVHVIKSIVRRCL